MRKLHAVAVADADGGGAAQARPPASNTTPVELAQTSSAAQSWRSDAHTRRCGMRLGMPALWLRPYRGNLVPGVSIRALSVKFDTASPFVQH